MAAQRTNWSNNLEMEFLEHYQSEEILWNAKNPIYKNKQKKIDAWRRISSLMDIEIDELKRKKDSLLSSYRFYKKKVRDSVRAGAGAHEVYKPIWFAYDYLDSFLGDGSTLRNSTDTLLEDIKIEDPLSPEESCEDVDPFPSNFGIPTKRRHMNPEQQESCSSIKESFAGLTQAISRHNSQQSPPEDDCDRYAKILANKLRQLPEDARLIFMHQIDGLFLEQRGLMLNSNSYVLPPSSSNNFLEQNRPSSSYSSCSEPTTDNPIDNIQK